MIPGKQQTLDQIAARMNDARRELMEAVHAGRVAWYRPTDGSRFGKTVWDRGSRRAQTVTGEVNWLRSHGLATLGQDVKTDATARVVVLTGRGRTLLDFLPPS